LTALTDAEEGSSTFGVSGTSVNADSSSASLAGEALNITEACGLALSLRTHLAFLNFRAFYFWLWSGNVSWWALADVLVVVSCAEGVLSACVGLADVQAGVRKTVAILLRRTVVVFQAVHQLTS
jgi:hypothetical protein